MKDEVSWGTMISCFVQVEWLAEAMTMSRAMLCNGLAPNDAMIVDFISACGKSMALGEARGGQQFHDITVKTCFDCNDFIYATIIHI